MPDFRLAGGAQKLCNGLRKFAGLRQEASLQLRCTRYRRLERGPTGGCVRGYFFTLARNRTTRYRQHWTQMSNGPKPGSMWKSYLEVSCRSLMWGQPPPAVRRAKLDPVAAEPAPVFLLLISSSPGTINVYVVRIGREQFSPSTASNLS